MKCGEVEKNLIRYLENDLPDNKYIRMKDHLDNCSHCKNLLHEVQLTLQVISHERVKETNPFFYTRLIQRIESETGHNSILLKEKHWKRILYPALYAAFIAFAILLGIHIGTGKTGNIPEINREEYIQAYSQSSHLYEMDEEFIEDNLLSDNSPTENTQK